HSDLEDPHPKVRSPAVWLRLPQLCWPEPARVHGASVTFDPGDRTAWHKHPLGQTLRRKLPTKAPLWVTVDEGEKKSPGNSSGACIGAARREGSRGGTAPITCLRNTVLLV